MVIRRRFCGLTAKMIFLHKMLADILNLHAEIRIIYQMCKKNSRFGKVLSVLLVKDFVYKYCICQKNILPITGSYYVIHDLCLSYSNTVTTPIPLAEDRLMIPQSYGHFLCYFQTSSKSPQKLITHHL